MSSVSLSVAAAIAARRTVSAESQIEARTARGLTWELTRATIEVTLVARVRMTADQPRLSNSEAST